MLFIHNLLTPYASVFVLCTYVDNTHIHVHTHTTWNTHKHTYTRTRTRAYTRIREKIKLISFVLGDRRVLAFQFHLVIFRITREDGPSIGITSN